MKTGHKIMTQKFIKNIAYMIIHDTHFSLLRRVHSSHYSILQLATNTTNFEVFCFLSEKKLKI